MEQSAQLDAERTASGRRPNPRLQAWGGLAAIAGALLTVAPGVPGLPPGWFAGGVQAAAVVTGAVLLVASATLLAIALVGDRAPLGKAKLGGILLLLFHCWWFATLLVPEAWWFAGGVAAGEASTLVRLLLGIAAGALIAASWPVRGFNRWSMLLVAACFSAASYGAYAVMLASPRAGAVAVLLSMLYPLALVAFGVGHAVAGRQGSRARADG